MAGNTLAKPVAEVAPSLDLTFRAGMFAVGSTIESEKGFELESRPALILSLQTPRTRLDTTYALTAAQRWAYYSKKFNRDDFRLQHLVNVQHQFAVSRRTDWTNRGSLGWGETSYSQSLASLGGVDPQTQTGGEATGGETLAGSRPETRTMRFVNMSASSAMSYSLTRTQSMEFGVDYSSTRQLGSTTVNTGGSNTGLPTMHNFRANSRYSLTASAKDDVTAALSGSYAMFSNDRDAIAVTSSAGLRHQINRKTTGTIQGGVALDLQSEFNGRRPTDARYWRSLFPVGQLSISVSPIVNARVPWSFNAGLGVASYLDPVRTEVLPRLTGNMGVSAELNARLQFQTTISLSTVITSSDNSPVTGQRDYPGNARVNSALTWNLNSYLNFVTSVTAGTNTTYPFKGKWEYGGQELYGGIALVATLNP